VSAPAYLNPPQIARKLSVKPHAVGKWIRSGELAAVDLSERRGKRPRWRVSQEAFQAFLEARSNRKPTPAPRRRQRAALELLEVFK
jgi:Helix-turn-helix domain